MAALGPARRMPAQGETGGCMSIARIAPREADVVKQTGPVISRHGLDQLGLDGVGRVRWNLPAPPLVQLAIAGAEGHLVAGGAFSAATGRHTGRAPRDRFIVAWPEVQAEIDWGKVNQPMAPDAAARLWAKAGAYALGRELYVQDLYAGADPAHRLQGPGDHRDRLAQPVRAQHVPGAAPGGAP